MSDLHELTALEQGAALKAGEFSATELARHYLDRIATIDPAINAFVTVTEELALEQAATVDRALASGRPLGPLSGVPVAVKDTARIEEVRRTCGSAANPAELSDMDDHVVTRMKDAGLVILGTTNTPEFALPCYTENRIGPPTRNPWSHRHGPGGSSGGSAAAVAAGLAPLGHGTDAGGSVRIPASACGIAGLKPSRGRISNGPVDHDITGLSTPGTLGRTTADAAAFLDLLTGPMPGDSVTAPVIPARPGKLRIAVMPEPMLPEVSAHPDCLAAVDFTVELLTSVGHEVEELQMSPDQQVADAFADTWSVVASRIEVEDEDALMPFTRYLRDRGNAVSGPRLHEALTIFTGIGQLLADLFFANYDVILTPTLATPPPLIGEFTGSSDEAENYAAMSAFMPYTPMYNLTGLPAVSVPLYWNAAGLPIGVMLGGRYGEEAALVALATELETAAGLPAVRKSAPHRAHLG